MNNFLKWHIYRANLDPVVGSEQGKSRPVLIVSEDAVNEVLNCVNAVPTTSRKEGRIIYPNEALLPAGTAGLANESVALCHQVRTLDKRRLSTEFGEINDPALRQSVLDALGFQFGIGE
jgi:mRNA interferase MazF